MAYLINLDECADICTHWIALNSNDNTITQSDSFDVEQIPELFIKYLFIERSSIKGSIITTIIFRIQAFGSIMCGCFGIKFIDFMFKGKGLTI